MGVKNFIKKSVAFVSAMAMACSMVVMPAGVSYAAETTNPNDNLHLSKGIELQPDGNYKITLEAYATGQDTTVETQEPIPLDIVLVLDQSGSMDNDFGSGWFPPSRLEALKSSATDFINSVKEDASKNNVNHRISVVGFASTKSSSTYKNTEILTVDGNSPVNYKTSSDNDSSFETALENSLMDVQTESTKITQAINWLDASGDTYSEYGMDMASRILAKYPVQKDENRKQVIVMFTDGYTAPSGTNNIDYTMSDRAIANAKVAKDAGATIYTIGIFAGANPTMDINNNYEYNSKNSSKQLVAANRYMNLVSSNYPKAENMTTTGTKVENAVYYQAASDSDELDNIFGSISKSEITSKPIVTLDSNSVLRDIISDNFELPQGAEASSVSVYTADSDTVSADGKTITWKDRVQVENPGVSISGNQVDVKGFDYSQNYVTASHPGKKLIVEVLVNGLQSGVDMDSNDTEQAKSGIYATKDATTAVKNFVSPIVTIPEYSYVLDYGKKVTLPNEDKNYIETTKINSTKAAPTTISSITKDYGTFTLGNNIISYQPEKINWDGFDSIFNFGKKTDNSYEWSKVNVIPATSVYYEDDFGSFTADNPNKDANVAIVWTGKWSEDSDKLAEGESSKKDNNQSSNNTQYGWDDSYVDDNQYSNGSAHYSSDSTATAKFRFTGTAVDVYSRTNNTVGNIIAKIKKVEKDENGNETLVAKKTAIIDNQSVSGDYYQIPTLNFEMSEYGTYEVTIMVSPVTSETENRLIYYLDGIRVYNPLQGNVTAEEIYDKAGEASAQYIKVRKDLLDSTSVTAIDSEIEGSVFIDKSETKVGDSTDVIGTYKTYGPKNEVYLKEKQGVAFTINNYNPEVNKVFIGLKSPTGKATTALITSGTQKVEETVSSASDLYYEITPTSDGKVVIQNTTDNLLSITKIRITTTSTPSNQSYSLRATPALMSYVDEFDTLSLKEETTEDQDTTLDKDDVEIDNPTEDDIENDNSNEDTEENTNSSSIWDKIMSSIKNWFR